MINPGISIAGCTAALQSGELSVRDLATAYYDRGVSHEQLSQHQMAIADFDQAIRLNPSEPSYRGTLAAAYAAAGMFEDAAREERAAITIWTDAGNVDLPTARKSASCSISSARAVGGAARPC